MRPSLAHWKTWLAALLLSAPAAFAAGAQADEYSKFHTVAVVVVTGNEITLRKLSLLSFTEGEQHFTARTDIDGTVQHWIETALATRFTVAHVADAASLRDLKGDAFLAGLRQLRTDGPPVDAYVLVGLGAHSFGRIEWRGIGLDEVGDDAPSTALYTHLFLEVIDAHSGERIDHGDGKFPHGGPFGGVEPIQNCDGALWPGDATRMTPQQQALIESEVLAALKASVPNMLDNADLPTATGYTFDTHSGDALGSGVCHRP